MFGSDKVSPEVLLGLGNLARGNNWGEQFANAGTGVLTAVNAQKDKAATQDVVNKTAQMLEIEAPDLAVAVKNGALTATDGYKQYLERKASANKPSEFKTLDDGTYGAWDGKTFNPLGKTETASKLPAIAQEYNFAKSQGFKGSFEDYQNRKTGPSQKDNFESEQTLWKNWRGDADVKEYQGVRNGFEKIRVSAIDPTGPKDLGIIFGYMKMLDPTSVVREGEQASVANSGGVPQQILSLYNRTLTGEKLPDQVRNDILKAAEGLYSESAKNYEAVNSQVKNMADRYGVDPQFITPAEKYEPLKIGQKVETTTPSGKKATIERVPE